MTKRTLIAIVATMVACKQSAAPAAAGPSGSGSTAIPVPTPDAPTAPTPSGKPLSDAISEAAAGKPVLFALDAKGELVARTTDGSYTSVLLPGPYGDALHDSALELIWLRRDAGLDVLDLRMPGPALAKTVATAPDKVLEALGEHFSEAPHWDMTSGVVVNLETSCSRGVLAPHRVPDRRRRSRRGLSIGLALASAACASNPRLASQPIAACSFRSPDGERFGELRNGCIVRSADGELRRSRRVQAAEPCRPPRSTAAPSRGIAVQMAATPIA